MKVRRTHPYPTEIRLFTLVELIAATAVMLFVALIIATASASFYNAWKRSVRITDKLKVYQNIDRIMDSGIRNMIPFTWKNENQEETVVFEGEPDTIFFVTPRRVMPGEKSAFSFIRLKVENENLIAEYHPLPRTQWDEENKLEIIKEVLAVKVRSISFLYARINDEMIEWDEDWEEYDRDTIQDDTRDILMIPLAVQMKVEWMDGSSEVWLRRTSGVSGHSRLGSGTGLTGAR
ncbi:MAG: hypothetical protein J6W81_09260 [Lentisphaeria bacterium]|nr:hypothetical protein [Lentisphaeria bacterium]